MDKKEENHIKIAWLNRYRSAVREEQMILEEIQRLREDKMLPALVMDGMPHASGGGDLSTYAAKLDEQMQMLKEWQFEEVKAYESILSKVKKVEDDNQRALLICRYIKGMGWDDVADTLGYSLRWTHRLHSRALDSINIE